MKLLAAVSALIVYGSFYPFDVVPPADPTSAIRLFFTNGQLWTSRGDVLGNVGLFVPFGMAGVYGASPGRARVRAAILTVAGGLLLALLIQVGQIWVPSRSAVLSDVLWNAAGVVIGAAAAMSLRSPLVFRRVRAEAPVLPPLLLLAVWLLAELAPLVPSIDLSGIRRSLAFALRPPSADGVELAFRAAQVMLAGRLLADVVRSGSVHRSLGALLVTVAAGKVLMIELALTWTIIGGFVVGFVMWQTMSLRLESRVRSSLMIALLLLTYALSTLHPFVWRQPVPFIWVPFASVLDGWMLGNVRALATKTFVFGGCLWLMRRRGWSPLGSTFGVAAFALVLEVCQMWIVGRTPSSTEPAVALLSGWALTQSPRSAATASVAQA
jgi:VanZ family protein